MHYSFNPQLHEKDTVTRCRYGDITTLELNITEIVFFFMGAILMLVNESGNAWLSVSSLKLKTFSIFLNQKQEYFRYLDMTMTYKGESNGTFMCTYMILLVCSYFLKMVVPKAPLGEVVRKSSYTWPPL